MFAPLALFLPLLAADPVDDYIRAQLSPRHLPAVSLAIVRHGQIVKSAGYGIANLELSVPATDRTVYEIGSISKHFTALAILLLKEDGKLSLDDPISKYIPQPPAAWAPITLRHILNHTAGLPDFDTGNIGFSYRRDYTPAEFIALLAAKPLAFPPGDRWNYANSFPLLGPVIERAAQMPYPEFLHKRIFTPLGLTSARIKSPTEIVPHRAAGYIYKDGVHRHGEPLRPAIIAPNGGLLMNAIDFAKWDIALTQGKLLKPESIREMKALTRLNNGQTVSHGLAWFTDTFNGHRFGAHWGSTVAGYSAVIRRYDEGLTVIVLANLEDGAKAVDELSKWIAGHYLPGASIETIQSQSDYLGEEKLTPYHFNLNPAVKTIRRYRKGKTYLTLRLDAEGKTLAQFEEN